MFAPLSTSVPPAPAPVSVPLPLMTLAKSVPCVMVLVRLKISAALSARALLGESEPVVPALPISSVPLETVVVPVYVLGPLKISRPVPVSCARP